MTPKAAQQSPSQVLVLELPANRTEVLGHRVIDAIHSSVSSNIQIPSRLAPVVSNVTYCLLWPYVISVSFLKFYLVLASFTKFKIRDLVYYREKLYFFSKFYFLNFFFNYFLSHFSQAKFFSWTLDLQLHLATFTFPALSSGPSCSRFEKRKLSMTMAFHNIRKSLNILTSCDQFHQVQGEGLSFFS